MKKLVVLLCLALTACGTVLPQSRVTHVVPRVRMDIHADTSFTSRERILINEASTRMFSQTNGFVGVDVVFDLDFNSNESLRDHVAQNIMVRVDQTAEGLEKSTLGYCYTNYKDLDFNNPIKIALVYDRLPTDEAWIHVAMHEMLHAIRAQHISEPQSILYKTTPTVGPNIVTCLTHEDMVEICTVHGCDLAAMKPCSP